MKPTKLVGVLSVIAGIIMIVAGAVTWGMVSSQLKAENITVPGDSTIAPGKPVQGPITAYAQADIINHHALEGTGGKTYAELAQDDPVRTTMMNASFLRTSLFTSVVSFGVAAFAIGIGILSILFGWALNRLASVPVIVRRSTVTRA